MAKKNVDAGILIGSVCDNIKSFLLIKNHRYGNSALCPVGIFSKIDAGSQICNRIDNKLSRIKNAKDLRKNDVVDLIGYLVLLLIQKGWVTFDELID